jgi:hypothetical protein
MISSVGVLLFSIVVAQDAAPTQVPPQAHAPASATVPLIRSSITAEQLRKDVGELSSDEMGGRFFRSPFAEKAAQWISARMASEGIEMKRIPIDSNPETGPNLIGIFEPPADGRTDGCVLVTAHYDHLRPKRSGEDRIHNGADDNASGVAGMLAVAHALKECAAAKLGPHCRVVFVAFNGEEAGLVGSRAFVKSPPVPLGEIRALFNMDMISRGSPRQIFIDGGPVGASAIATLRRANESIGLTLRVDEHPDWLDRSDQGPFLRQNVPAVLFSVEDHEDYHRVTDEVAKIDASLAAEVAQLVTLAVIDASAQPFAPRATAPDPQPPTAPPTIPAAPSASPATTPAAKPITP